MKCNLVRSAARALPLAAALFLSGSQIMGCANSSNGNALAFNASLAPSIQDSAASIQSFQSSRPFAVAKFSTGTQGEGTLNGFVGGIYNTFYGTTPSSEQYNGAYNQYNQGSTPFQMSNQIIFNQSSNQSWISNLYSQYVNGEIDPNLLNSYTQMFSEQGPQSVEASLLGSSQYYSAHGNCASGFVNGLYQNVLKAQPDSQYNYFLGLANSGMNRTQIATQFFNQTNFYSNNVSNYFNQLGLPTDPQVQSNYVGQLQNGLPWDQFISVLLSSREYIQSVANNAWNGTNPWGTLSAPVPSSQVVNAYY